MKYATWAQCALSCAVALVSATAVATDYYVATTGDDSNDGLSAESPFATIDKAVITARTSGDIIHVQPGEYETTLGIYSNDNSKWGPNLCVKMVGEGATRDDVILKSHGSHRTLRMAAGSWVENMTLEGEPTFKADKGGVIEMSGGTLTNCVVRNGTATGNGGNIYASAGTIVDCVISNGTINSTNSNWDGPKGVNAQINGATSLIRCLISGGTTTPINEETGAFYYERGNVAINNSSAQVDNCLIKDCECGGIVLQSTGSKVYNTTIVSNACYGVWSWNQTQTLVNCVIYGNRKTNGSANNWAGNQPGGDAVFVNCAAESGTFSGSYSTLVTVSDGDFADFSSGDYHPAANGSLVDAGGADPRGSAASSTDLDGNPRKSGTIDIGCYEYQKPEMTVRIDGAAYSSMFAPATVTFAHSTTNSASPENVVFTYDFGDGSEPASTTLGTISHTYDNPGIYTVKIAATNDCEEESAELVNEGYVRVASPTVYVNEGGNGAAFPYDTPETAFASVSAALAHVTETAAPEIKVAPGIYGQTAALAISTSVKISGMGATPGDVILRNTASGKRVMEIGEGTTAWIENLTMEGGQDAASGGGNLLAKSGTITNCIIRGGSTTSCPGGGVRLDGGAPMLTHCVITNNAVVGTPGDSAMRGGAVYLHYGSAAKVSNCLIAFNTYSPSTEKVRGSAGLVLFGSNGSAVIQNCSVVSNMVIGTISDNMAAAWSGSWDTVVRNCVFAGNYVTGAGKCSGITFPSQMKVSNCVIDDSSDSRCATATVAKMFRDFGKGDFRPLPGGALFNKGVTPTISTSVDLAGNPRIFGKTIDIGCYECQTQPHTVILMR